MSKRLAFEEDDKDDRPGVLKGLVASGTSIGKVGFEWARWTARITGRTGWILLTTAAVTLVPLVFEVTREAQLIEQEKMQINALLAEGKTRHEIASLGLYSALDPNVMGRET